MDDDGLLEVLDAAVTAVQRAMLDLDDWGPAGTRDGQHHSDLAADAAIVAELTAAGLGVLSEESGRQGPDGLVAVVDPLDGSTNAAHGVPWFATSICVVDHDGPRVALVVDLVAGTRYEAVRGRGARRDGATLRRGPTPPLHDALVGISGLPPWHLGWAQFRALGAAALDLCAVADGRLDGYVDCSFDAHGVWDYLGGLLVCQEAGAVVADGAARDLLTLDHDARRTPVAAGDEALLAELLEARASFD